MLRAILVAFLLLASATVTVAQTTAPLGPGSSGPGGSGGGGSGTVTAVSVVSANGISGMVANPTTTPAITLALGAITPTSVAIGAGSVITSSGSGGALTAPAFASFGTASGNVVQGGVITAGGPTGSATVVPIITYNAAGQLTTVSSATITPAIGSVTGLGTGVATALGNTAGGGGGFALVGTTPPTGAAGGDLAGTYPNPTLAWISRSATQTLNIGAGGTLGALSFVTPGTGVATALGVNVGSAGAPVLLNGAGGTPSSLVGTNITGTASGLTAGNVTTNANLTGDVTSVGNAATIAASISGAKTFSTSVAIGAGSAITSSGPGGALASGAYTAAYSLPTATNSVLGGVKPDGTTITNTAGAIAAASTTINGTTCTPGSTCTVTPAITSKVVNTSYDLTTASGTQVVSGFGFTPSSCEGFGAVAGVAFGSYQTYNAHVDNSLVQGSLNGTVGQLSVGPSQFFIAQDVTGTNFQIGVVSSFGSGTMTITWTKGGSPTGTFAQSIRCFK